MHFSRNCPEQNKVQSSSNKPPGVASFGIDVDFGDIENQHELSVQSLDCEIAANNINVAVGGNENDEDPGPDDLPETDNFDMESDIVSSELDDETSIEDDSRSYNPWIGDPLGNRAEERCRDTRVSRCAEPTTQPTLPSARLGNPLACASVFVAAVCPINRASAVVTRPAAHPIISHPIQLTCSCARVYSWLLCARSLARA